MGALPSSFAPVADRSEKDACRTQADDSVNQVHAGKRLPGALGAKQEMQRKIENQKKGQKGDGAVNVIPELFRRVWM